jgi:type IX secretion system PorP/SprF family membrane protein
MHKLLPTLLWVCFLSPFYCRSQQLPLYTQYIFDPYLINPSMLATTRKSEVNLLYRQQWTGIDDGPKTLQFDFQHAINNRMAFGVNIYDDKTVLLSRTSVMTTFGYRVPLAKEHILSFGLSGGFNSNRISLEDVPNIDINDPVLLNSSANNFSFDGQFGVNYNFRNLVVGFSLVRLLDNKTFSEEQLQSPEFNELKNKIIFATYKFNLSETFSLQPNFAYRITADNLNFFEASAIFSYKDMVSVGGGYRENYGPTAITRVTIKDLQVGFAYDFPSTKAEVSTGGTNEIQLKWRFGKVLDKLSKREKILEEPNERVTRNKNQVPIQEEPVALKAAEPIKEEPSVVTMETVVVIEAEKPIEEIKSLAISEETLESNEYLLIAGTFSRKANAEKLVKELSVNGIASEILQPQGDKYYYVHIPSYKTDNVTLEKLLKIRNIEGFKDAWYKKMGK